MEARLSCRRRGGAFLKMIRRCRTVEDLGTQVFQWGPAAKPRRRVCPLRKLSSSSSSSSTSLNRDHSKRTSRVSAPCISDCVSQTRDLGVVTCSDLAPTVTLLQKRINVQIWSCVHLRHVMLTFLFVHFWFTLDQLSSIILLCGHHML